MSREFSQHSIVAQDLFDRDAGGIGATCVTAANEDTSANVISYHRELKKRRASFSENLWEDARRRHCDARQNWRTLLDRFVKPHL